MSHRDLLIEIGTEELPPTALNKLEQAFAKSIGDGLQKADLPYTRLTSYSSPRRLAVVVEALIEKQPDREVEKRGPAVKAAFDADGNPTKALMGFARSCGAEIEALETMETDKGSWLVFREQQQGAATETLLGDILDQALNALPIPKRMRWADRDDAFVRPVHWLVVLFGDQLVPLTRFGIDAGRQTYGHRFHHPDAIPVESPQQYASQLAEIGSVIAETATRREMIEKQVHETATRLGGEAVINPDLLDEVTGLVEWPVALSGEFDQRFLELPPEALISSMEGHQKYFAVRDKDGALLPYFITVSNIESRDPAQVVGGNERVIRPRLADAAFFWDTDRKQPLADRLPQLKSIVFQNKLGTLFDKSQRVADLAVVIADSTGVDAKQARRAAELAKCDLLTEMVGEFPDLQGIMGRYYAQLDGETAAVADALDEQYMPRFAGDALPAGQIGQTLSLAEKIDTLVGLFGIGQPPTGVKDPFALRRASLGLLRIMIEKQLPLNLPELLQASIKGYGDRLTQTDVVEQVMQYCYDRLKAYVTDQGYAADVYEAVVAVRPESPYDFMQRVVAVAEFRQMEQADSLAAGHKRIGNILRKNADEYESQTVDRTLLTETAEQHLADSVESMQKAIAPLMAEADYAGVLTRLAGLRDSVDTFFDDVMVMAEDRKIRHNRFALLEQTQRLFLEVADIGFLQA